MTDAAYASLMFGIYLTGTLVFAGMSIFQECAWRSEFSERPPSEVRWGGWLLAIVYAGAALAFTRFMS